MKCILTLLINSNRILPLMSTCDDIWPVSDVLNVLDQWCILILTFLIRDGISPLRSLISDETVPFKPLVMVSYISYPWYLCSYHDNNKKKATWLVTTNVFDQLDWCYTIFDVTHHWIYCYFDRVNLYSHYHLSFVFFSKRISRSTRSTVTTTRTPASSSPSSWSSTSMCSSSKPAVCCRRWSTFLWTVSFSLRSRRSASTHCSWPNYWSTPTPSTGMHQIPESSSSDSIRTLDIQK